MLKGMRKNMKIIMWFLVGAFVLWTASSAIMSAGRGGGTAGIVFGKKVSEKEFAAGYGAVINHAKLMYGEKFHEMRKFLNLQDTAWERIIMLKEAKRRKITVRNDEVIDRVARMPLFQDASGKFLAEIYSRVITHFLNTSPRVFEEEMRDSLALGKLHEEAVKGAAVTDEEILGAYKKRNEKADADFIIVSADDFNKGLAAEEAETQTYYETRGGEFMTEPKVNVEYIRVDFAAFKEKAAPAESAAEEEQAKTEEEPAKKAEDKADELVSLISYDLARERNPDLHAAAAKHNVPVKETGFFGMNEAIGEIGLSYQFAIKAFQLQEGEVSSPVKTKDAFCILKYKGRQEPYIPPFEEVKDRVKEAVIAEKAKDAAKKKAAEYADSIKEKAASGVNFKKAAEELGLEVKNTGPFSREGYIPHIGNSQEFKDAAFAAAAGGIGPVVPVPQGAAIFSVSAIQRIDEAKYEAEKDKFRQDALQKKQNEYFEEWFARLKEKAGLKILLEE